MTKARLFCTLQDPTTPMHLYKKIFSQEEETEGRIFITFFFVILHEIELEETILSTFDVFREGQLDHLQHK